MPYGVELTDRARKQYQALDRSVRDRVRAALHKLSDDPTPPTVKALSGSDDLLRIRVGDWLSSTVSNTIRHERSSWTLGTVAPFTGIGKGPAPCRATRPEPKMTPELASNKSLAPKQPPEQCSGGCFAW